MAYYNLESLVDLIKERNFKVISIQCSDTNESIRLCDYLQDTFTEDSSKKFYILGDVLTGSCCLDIIATKRLNAECIIYIGESCFFKLETSYYIFHLYHKLNVDFSLLEEKVDYISHSYPYTTLLYIYKSSLHHVLEKVCELFLTRGNRVLAAVCPDPLNFGEFEENSAKFCNREVHEFYIDEGKVVSKRLREDLFSRVDLIFYLNDNEDENLSKSIVMEGKFDNFYELKITDYVLNDRNDWAQKVLLKRYLSVEKAKCSESFGIITLTKSFQGGNNLRRLLLDLITKMNKKCTLFCINHLTEAKLRNFPKVETWILLSCNLTQLSLERDLGRLVIFPFELLVALDVLNWSEDHYIFDFNTLGNIIQNFITSNFSDNINGDDGDKNSLEGEEDEQLRRIGNMELSKRFDHLYENIRENEKREFKGLDPNFNFDKKPTILKGSTGTPASYKHELEYQ